MLGIVGATLGLVIASWVLPGFELSGWEDARWTSRDVAHHPRRIGNVATDATRGGTQEELTGKIDNAIIRL